MTVSIYIYIDLLQTLKTHLWTTTAGMSQFQVNQECFCPDNKYSNSINIPGIAWFGQCHLHRCWRGNFWPDFGSQTEKAWRERSKGLASSGQNKQSSVKYRELSLFFLHKATRFQCVVRETSRNIYRNTLAFAWNRGLSRACFHTFQAMSHELSGPSGRKSKDGHIWGGDAHLRLTSCGLC